MEKTYDVRIRLPEPIFDRYAIFAIHTGESLSSILTRLAIRYAPPEKHPASPAAPLEASGAAPAGRRAARSTYLAR